MIDNKDNYVQDSLQPAEKESDSPLYKSAARKATQHHRRVLEKGDERGSFTAEEWLQLCSQYRNRCALCGFERPLTPDHVVPVFLGGRNTIDNIQPLCRPCNMAKFRTPADYTWAVLPVRMLEHGQQATGQASTALKPIWREELAAIEAQLLNGRVDELMSEGMEEQIGQPHCVVPLLQIEGVIAAAPVSHEHRGQDLSRWRREVGLALIVEIRRLRSLVLENEGLASAESVAWWSRDTLPAALEAYLSLQGRVGENP